MTNKELRIKIYSWLKVSFDIDFDVIDSKKRNELKKILKEFNPEKPMYIAKGFKIDNASKIEPGEIIKVSDWNPYPILKRNLPYRCHPDTPTPDRAMRY